MLFKRLPGRRPAWPWCKSDCSLVSGGEVADALHLAGALVLDLRHEGMRHALGRVDALVTRFAAASLQAEHAEGLVLEVRRVVRRVGHTA